MSRTGRPIEAAYYGTLDSPCPMCLAPKGEHCTDEFGRSRRVPCVKRPRIPAHAAAADLNDPDLVSRRPGADHKPPHGVSDRFLGGECAAVDFSQPRRSMEEDEWS